MQPELACNPVPAVAPLVKPRRVLPLQGTEALRSKTGPRPEKGRVFIRIEVWSE